MSMKVSKVINLFQFVNWSLCCLLIVYFIFIVSSPSWLMILMIGVAVQLLLSITNWFRGNKVNSKWILYNALLLVLVVWFDLASRSVIPTDLFNGEAGFITFYLLMLLTNGLFFISIRNIITEYKRINGF